MLPSRAFWGLGAAAALGVAAAPACGQDSAGNHAAHHPQGGQASATPPQDSSPPRSTADEGCESCGDEGYRAPLYPRLLTLAPDDAPGRRALAAQAEHRMLVAARSIRSAAAAIDNSGSEASNQAALLQLQEARAEYESAAAVARALRSGDHSQSMALNWFRRSMNLDVLPHADAEGLFGLSALHLVLMTMAGLLAAGLLGLQFRRLSRARELLRTSEIPGPGTSIKHAIAAEPTATTQALVKPGGKWSGLLRVAHIIAETPTVETYRLVPLEGEELPFSFLPGQFLQVQIEAEPGKSSRRSYTIASSPSQRGFAEITVKREEHGVVSKYLNEKLAVGDQLHVSGPFGAFTFNGTYADSIVLIAGGVGITPVMSVLRYLTDKAWPGEIFLLYGARSTNEFVFREEIERLERRHANLHVLATMQRSPGTVWLGPEGNLTKELVAGAVPRIFERRIHLCGPPPMMNAVRDILLELGVAEAQIHTEAFGPASLPPENAPAAVTGATSHGPVRPQQAPAVKTEVATTTVTFSVSGIAAPLRADETVLEAAEGAGVEIPYSCRIGECGVCVTKLQQGSVTMDVETGLDPADKSQGYVLACQAKTTGGPLVVEA